MFTFHASLDTMLSIPHDGTFVIARDRAGVGIQSPGAKEYAITSASEVRKVLHAKVDLHLYAVLTYKRVYAFFDFDTGDTGDGKLIFERVMKEVLPTSSIGWLFASSPGKFHVHTSTLVEWSELREMCTAVNRLLPKTPCDMAACRQRQCFRLPFQSKLKQTGSSHKKTPVSESDWPICIPFLFGKDIVAASIVARVPLSMQSHTMGKTHTRKWFRARPNPNVCPIAQRIHKSNTPSYRHITFPSGEEGFIVSCFSANCESRALTIETVRAIFQKMDHAFIV